MRVLTCVLPYAQYKYFFVVKYYTQLIIAKGLCYFHLIPGSQKFELSRTHLEWP